jgi:hypothetical protein
VGFGGEPVTDTVPRTTEDQVFVSVDEGYELGRGRTTIRHLIE